MAEDRERPSLQPFHSELSDKNKNEPLSIHVIEYLKWLKQTERGLPDGFPRSILSLGSGYAIMERSIAGYLKSIGSQPTLTLVDRDFGSLEDREDITGENYTLVERDLFDFLQDDPPQRYDMITCTGTTFLFEPETFNTRYFSDEEYARHIAIIRDRIPEFLQSPGIVLLGVLHPDKLLGHMESQGIRHERQVKWIGNSGFNPAWGILDSLPSTDSFDIYIRRNIQPRRIFFWRR